MKISLQVKSSDTPGVYKWKIEDKYSEGFVKPLWPSTPESTGH